MRQRGQDAGCGGFERYGLALEVYAVDFSGRQGLEDCTDDADKAEEDLRRRLTPLELPAPSLPSRAPRGFSVRRLTLFFAAVAVQELPVRPGAGEVILVVLHD